MLRCWLADSPQAKVFIFPCLTFPAVTGVLKKEPGEGTSPRTVDLKRYRVASIRSLVAAARKPNYTVSESWSFSSPLSFQVNTKAAAV